MRGKAGAKRRKTRAGHAARAAQDGAKPQAFVASSELRPMAQQLATMRTPAAYAGVAHTRMPIGRGGAAAYLALGHAYLVDKRFAEAQNLKLARQPAKSWSITRSIWARRPLTGGQ